MDCMLHGQSFGLRGASCCRSRQVAWPSCGATSFLQQTTKTKLSDPLPMCVYFYGGSKRSRPVCVFSAAASHSICGSGHLHVASLATRVAQTPSFDSFTCGLHFIAYRLQIACSNRHCAVHIQHDVSLDNISRLPDGMRSMLGIVGATLMKSVAGLSTERSAASMSLFASW